MFKISPSAVASILRDYDISERICNISELQRYHYERDNPNSKEVRLILKVDFEKSPSVVVRLKNEKNVTLELIESQSRFSEILNQNGISTPIQYRANGKFAKQYSIDGYDVIVAIEQFVANEIKIVDESIAQKTGKLLAKTHTIAERYDVHIKNDVLFNPFEHNDLFAFDTFITLENFLEGDNRILFHRIVDLYSSYSEILAPLRERPKYAVQGDISNNNLYLTQNGEIGIFDFNRSGDNILFCDAVMQSVFESKLMDYPMDKEDDFETKISSSFWSGYRSGRDLTKEEQKLYPYLYTIINAFWSFDILWSENSLLNLCKAGDSEHIKKHLSLILKRLTLQN